MVVKNFQQYLEKRLDADEVNEIEKLAQFELEKLVAMGGFQPPTSSL